MDCHQYRAADCFCQLYELIFCAKLHHYELRFCNHISHIGRAYYLHPHPLLRGFEDVDLKLVDYEILFHILHIHTLNNVVMIGKLKEICTSEKIGTKVY